MYGMVSTFLSWLNSNILSFSDGIKIPQKFLLLHTFSWDLSSFNVLKEKRQFKQQKSPSCFEVILLSHANRLF